jgi:hypothetical protein
MYQSLSNKAFARAMRVRTQRNKETKTQRMETIVFLFICYLKGIGAGT